jgi:hypothetical protein
MWLGKCVCVCVCVCARHFTQFWVVCESHSILSFFCGWVRTMLASTRVTCHSLVNRTVHEGVCGCSCVKFPCIAVVGCVPSPYRGCGWERVSQFIVVVVWCICHFTVAVVVCICQYTVVVCILQYTVVVCICQYTVVVCTLQYTVVVCICQYTVVVYICQYTVVVCMCRVSFNHGCL